MRRKGTFYIIVGILLALLAGLLTFSFFKKAQTQQVLPPTTRTVAVAIRDIAAGSVMDPLMVELRNMPIANLSPDAVANLADLSGKYARTAIYSGQVVEGRMLADAKALAEEGGLASALVPGGKVAYPFPITMLSGVAYALSGGDRVDVLITFRFRELDPASQTVLPIKQGESTEGGPTGDQLPRLVSQLTLQNVEVLRVGSWLKTPAPDAQQAKAQPTPEPSAAPAVVTLLLSQQDALVVQYARESGAIIELALRNPNDQDAVTTESVTLDYMLTRFNVTIPRKASETILVLP